MQNFIVDTLILRHEHRRIREKLNQTQYRSAQPSIATWSFWKWRNHLCVSPSIPIWKLAPPKSKWHYEFAPFNRICDGRSCAASNAGATLRFTAKLIVRICQLKKGKKEQSCCALRSLVSFWILSLTCVSRMPTTQSSIAAFIQFTVQEARFRRSRSRLWIFLWFCWSKSLNRWSFHC